MPGSRGGRGPLSFGVLGGFGAFNRIGFPFLRDPPTRDVGIGSGDGGMDSQSEAVNEVGESGFGGGSTSPGTVIRLLRSLALWGWLEALPVGLGPSSLSVMRGGDLRLVTGERGTGVGSLDGGFGNALSFVVMLASLL